MPGLSDGRVTALGAGHVPLPVRPGTGTAAVIGSGLALVRAASDLVREGLSVIAVCAGERVLPNEDEDTEKYLLGELGRRGVRFVTGQRLLAFDGGLELNIILEEDSFTADAAYLATGFRPDTAFLPVAPTEISPPGDSGRDFFAPLPDPYIFTVNPYCAANADAAAKACCAAAAELASGNAVPARMAECGVFPFGSVSAAFSGGSVRSARKDGVPAAGVSFFCGENNNFVRVAYNTKNGNLLGFRVIGDEAQKWHELLSAAVCAGVTGQELARLALSADPEPGCSLPCRAAFIADCAYKGLVPFVSAASVDELAFDERCLIVDLRCAEEFDRYHIPYSLSIPFPELRAKSGGLDRGKKILLACGTGQDSVLACRILRSRGFDCAAVSGGVDMYRALNRAHLGNAK